jgi:hypothetical protein
MLGANPMTWQYIIVTQLFWIVCTIGTLVLSIAANLLTPYVSAFITRHLHGRKSRLRDKQIKRREQVIALQLNVARRTSAKLDAIFKLLLAMVLLLLCLFLIQLSVNDFYVATLVIILLALLAAVAIGKLGLDDMSFAITADRREAALDDFLKQRGGGTSAPEVRQFEDEWDLRQFGVTSGDVGNAQNQPHV